MSISGSIGASRPQAAPEENRTTKPDVEAIMAGIRKTVRERAEEGGKTEREFKADLRKRMMQPFGARGFSEGFIERVRSRDQARWNLELKLRQLSDAPSAPMRMLRRLLSPIARLFVNLQPVFELTARQAEINEYHRRLLWAMNRDLELARLELDLVKRELRRLGVNAEFSFSRVSGSGEISSKGKVSGGRHEGRGGRQDRGRTGGRRSSGGRSDREGGGRRDRQGSRPPRSAPGGEKGSGPGGR